jgi:hypothetical protein
MSRPARWAYFSMLLGGVASLGGNVAYELATPHPSPLGIAFGVVVALAVLGAFGVLENTHIDGYDGWRAIPRLTAFYGGLGSVAGIAAVISYWHIRSLLTLSEGPGVIANIGPALADGLMIASGYAITVSRTVSRTVSPEKITTPVSGAARLPAAERTGAPEGKGTREGLRSVSAAPTAPPRVSVSSPVPEAPTGARINPVDPVSRDVGLAVLATLRSTGQPVTVRSFVAGLRALDHGMGTARASALLKELLGGQHDG